MARIEIFFHSFQGEKSHSKVKDSNFIYLAINQQSPLNSPQHFAAQTFHVPEFKQNPHSNCQKKIKSKYITYIRRTGNRVLYFSVPPFIFKSLSILKGLYKSCISAYLHLETIKFILSIPFLVIKILHKNECYA